jgi:hypothetical protein
MRESTNARSAVPKMRCPPPRCSTRWCRAISRRSGALKTAYPAGVARIGQVMRGMPRGTDLVVDFSAVGRGIYDMLVNDGLSPIGVTMTGGLDVHWNGSSLVTVPKLTLVSKLVARLHGGELLVHGDLADWPVLRRELVNFRPEVTRGGQETWNSRSGEHDDLVIATALCTWFLEGGRRFQPTFPRLPGC